MIEAYWSFDFSPLRISAAALLLLFTIALSIVQFRRGGRRRFEAWTEAIRLLAIALLAVTLLRPERVQVQREEGKPVLAVLMDASGSMVTPDVPAATGPGMTTRAEWLAPLRDAAAWSSLAGQYDVRLQDFGAPPAPPQDPGAPTQSVARIGTNMHTPLDDWARRAGAARAVLMIGDGDWTEGPSPIEAATRLRASSTPVFTLTTGAATFMPDVELVSVQAPAYAQVDEWVQLPLVVNSRLPDPVETAIVLLEDGVERSRRTIALPPMAQVATTLVFQPDQEGDRKFTLRVVPVDGESRTDNNERAFGMSLRKVVIRVLIVETEPRWEYRYLRNAAVRDPSVEVNTLLLHPGMKTGGGRGYLAEFPATREALAAYDVIFIGDVAMGEGGLNETQCGWIRDVVQTQASGLVFLPGPSGRWLSLAKGPLADLIPVDCETDRPQGHGMAIENRMALTMRGRDHRLTRLASTPEANERLWSTLPGFYWYAGVLRARPGSEVLAVHAQARNADGRVPLLVTRAAGAGKVLFMGHDSAWRWRRGVEDLHHYRFWVQVFRWMAHQRHLVQTEGLRFFFTPESPSIGDRLWVQATPLDAQGFPLERATVEGVMTTPSGVSVPMSFRPVENGWGAYQGDTLLREGGVHRLAVRCRETGKSAETTFESAMPDPEPVGRPARAEIMRELAAITGGWSAGADGVEAMLQRLRDLPPREPRETRFRLWCHPLWLAALSAGFGVYWVLRKLLGRI